MRYFLEISFKGTNYHGWQIQPKVISVQEVLTQCISKILQNEVSVVAAGRTDAGVHAEQMFAHFDFETVLQEDFVHRLNSVLPDDIVVFHCFRVEDQFHARFDAVSRSYEYRIYLGRNPFLLDTTWQIHTQQLNVDLMNEASKYLYQYDDFECFSKVKTDVKTFICKVYHAEWTLNGSELVFHITANRFLRNMVRAIVGTLIEVGKGNMSVLEFIGVIESKKRSEAGVSVPAKGLFLTKVKYNF